MSDWPRTRKVHYLATGTLHNAPCDRCGRDTLHRHSRCTECALTKAQKSLYRKLVRNGIKPAVALAEARR